MNLREFDKKITLLEGKKRSISIAQVAEVRKIIFEQLAFVPDETFIDWSKRFKWGI